LSQNLENLGYSFQEPELGGGGGDVTREVIAWINLHPISAELSTGLLVNMLWDLLKVSYVWAANHKKNKKVTPIMAIAIYDIKDGYDRTVCFDMEKKYSKAGIETAMEDQAD
jgi:hypothetical protein